MPPMAILLQKMSSFWQFFDIQMAVFRRVRFKSHYFKMECKNSTHISIYETLVDMRTWSHREAEFKRKKKQCYIGKHLVENLFNPCNSNSQTRPDYILAWILDIVNLVFTSSSRTETEMSWICNLISYHPECNYSECSIFRH